MSEAEEETVPLLPSLEEEFDEHSDVSGHRVAQTKVLEGKAYQCSMKMVILGIFVGLVVTLIIVGAVIGITVTLGVSRHGKSGGGSKVNSTYPIHTSTSNSNPRTSSRGGSKVNSTYPIHTSTSNSNPRTSSLAVQNVTSTLSVRTISTASVDVSASPRHTTAFISVVSSQTRVSLTSSSSDGITLQPTPTQRVFSPSLSPNTASQQTQTSVIMPSLFP